MTDLDRVESAYEIYWNQRELLKAQFDLQLERELEPYAASLRTAMIAANAANPALTVTKIAEHLGHTNRAFFYKVLNNMPLSGKKRPGRPAGAKSKPAKPEIEVSTDDLGWSADVDFTAFAENNWVHVVVRPTVGTWKLEIDRDGYITNLPESWYESDDPRIIKFFHDLAQRIRDEYGKNYG